MAAVCRVSTIHQVAEAHEVHHSQSRLDPFRWAELAGFPAREAAMPLDHTRLIDTSLRLAQMPLPASFATASSGWVLHFIQGGRRSARDPVGGHGMRSR